MPTSEYLKTPQGQLGRYHWRMLNGRVYVHLDEEPRSKKSMRPKAKIGFQQMLLSQLKQRSRVAFRGKIAAQFTFAPTSNNPPHIHRAIKNMQDLLGCPLQGAGIRRRGLIYYDDSQIAYLSVKYDLDHQLSHTDPNADGSRAEDKKPYITMDFAPFSHFLADLEFANGILQGAYDVHPRWNSGTQAYERQHASEELGLYSNMVANRDLYRTILGEDQLVSLEALERARAQDSVLANWRLEVSQAYQLYRACGLLPTSTKQNGVPERSRIDQFWREFTDLIIHSPLRIQLPNLPTDEGKKEVFLSQVRRALEAYRDKFGFLFRPLLVPVALEVLYKPPRSSHSFMKDLDNIMLEVLPIVHDVFQPPPALLATGRAKGRSAPVLKTVPYGVWRYDVMAIPRIDDQEEGFLSIGVTGGMDSEISLWDRVDQVIRRFDDNAKRS